MIVHLTLCERRSFVCRTDVCDVDAVVGQKLEIHFRLYNKNLTYIDLNTTYLVLIDNESETYKTLVGFTRSSSAAGKDLSISKERGQTGKVQIKDVRRDHDGEYHVEIQENNMLIDHILNISLSVHPRDMFDVPKCSVFSKSSNDMVQLKCQWNVTRFKGEAWILYGILNVTTPIRGGKRELSYYFPTTDLVMVTDPPASCILSRLGVVKTCNFSSVNHYTVHTSLENKGSISLFPCTEEHTFPGNKSVTMPSDVRPAKPTNVSSSKSINFLLLISCSITIIFTTIVCIYVSCSKFILSKCGTSRSSTEFNSPLNQNQSRNGLSEQDVELQAVSLHLKDQKEDKKNDRKNMSHGSDELRDTNLGRGHQQQSSEGISEKVVSQNVSSKQKQFVPETDGVRPEQSTIGYAFENVEYFDLGEIANCPEQQIGTGSDCKVELPENMYSNVEYFQNGCCSVPPDRDNENSREYLAPKSQGMGCMDSERKGCDPLNELYAKVDKNKGRSSQIISKPSCDADNSSPTV